VAQDDTDKVKKTAGHKSPTYSIHVNYSPERDPETKEVVEDHWQIGMNVRSLLFNRRGLEEIRGLIDEALRNPEKFL